MTEDLPTTHPEHLRLQLPLSCVDDACVMRHLERSLMAELAPSSMVGTMLARDLVQIEFDIMRLRQARIDVERQALSAQIKTAFENTRHGSTYYYGLRRLDKFITDFLGPRTDISRRNAFILDYFEIDLDSIRALAFRRDMEITNKIEDRLDKLEKRRRLLRRDYDVFASDQAQVIEAPQ